MNMEYDKTVVGHGMFGMLPQNPMFKQQKRPPTTIALDDLTQLSKNHKRVGSHAILTDYLLGKGHYGSVYLSYELPATQQQLQPHKISEQIVPTTPSNN